MSSRRRQVAFSDVPVSQVSRARDMQGFDQRQRQMLDQMMANLSKVRQLQSGSGRTAFRVGPEGLWLGAEKFEDAPFRVDMEGNVVAASLVVDAVQEVKDGIDGLSDLSENLGTVTAGFINGLVITGGIFRTGESGVRIEIDSPDGQNEIRFYDDTTLYAKLLVRKDGDDGLIELVDPDGAGFRLSSGVGASQAGSAALLSAGGEVVTSGSSTVGFVGLQGKDSKYVAIQHTGGGDAHLVSNALPTSDPEIVNALWNDSGTVKISSG